MDRHLDVGNFFVEYLVREFRKRAGPKADCLVDDWDGGRVPTSTFGGAALNVLIEFQPDEDAWMAEFAKPSRQRWCKRLGDVPSVQKLADRCHFIAWDGTDQSRIGALLAFYSYTCTPGLMLHSRETRAHSQSHSMFVGTLLERRHGASNSGLLVYLQFVAPLIVESTRHDDDTRLRMLWVHVRNGLLRGYWIDQFAALSGVCDWLGGNSRMAG